MKNTRWMKIMDAVAYDGVLWERVIKIGNEKFTIVDRWDTQREERQYELFSTFTADRPSLVKNLKAYIEGDRKNALSGHNIVSHLTTYLGE